MQNPQRSQAHERSAVSREVRDTALLWQPITMSVHGGGLQATIDHWHRQPNTHALNSEAQVVVTQLRRFDYVDHRALKPRDRVTLSSGDTLRMPVFSGGGKMHTYDAPYRLLFAIIHSGDHPCAGHYQSLLFAESQAF